MPRPWLGHIAYDAYCAALGQAPQWSRLSWQEQLAWGQSVQAGVHAATALPQALTGPAGPQDLRCQQAYMLYVLYRRPVAEVCATLGISCRTLRRYVARVKRAADAA